MNDNSSPVISNIILWANSDDDGANTGESAQMQTDGGAPVVNYSCIQGLTGDLGGTGNVGGDPQFVDADGLDDLPGTRDDNLRLAPGSACIDAGDNLSMPADTEDVDEDGDFDEPVPIDLDFHARFVDDPATPDSGNVRTGGPIPAVDIGSYEYLAGDSDGDGDADLSDYFGFRGCQTGPGGGVTPECDVFDLDDDGDVDLQDWGYFQISFTGPK